jgi:hypothetical protein
MYRPACLISQIGTDVTGWQRTALIIVLFSQFIVVMCEFVFYVPPFYTFGETKQGFSADLSYHYSDVDRARNASRDRTL